MLLPLSQDQISEIRAGQIIRISGIIYTARDAAHKRITEALKKEQTVPIDLKDATIYYCGPTPQKNDEIIGSCGPTTSGRMDDFTPALLDAGVKITIGKGQRNQEVVKSIIKNKCLYLIAVGGAGALTKSYVKNCSLAAYEDLKCEAIYKLEVSNMELIVAIDSLGNNIFD